MVHVVIVHLRVVYDVIHLTLNGPSCFEENLKLEQKKIQTQFSQRLLPIEKRSI